MLMPVRAEPAKTALRFVLVLKVSHPWFEEVRLGALAAARMITSQTGRPVTVDYQPPAQATVEQQQAILSRAINSKADGIFIDLLDASRLTSLLVVLGLRGFSWRFSIPKHRPACRSPAWATTTASRPRLPLSAW